VRCAALEQCRDERRARRIGERGGERTGRARLALEQEPEILHGADGDESTTTASLVELHHRGAALRVALHQSLGELRPFDPRPRIAEPVGEITEQARDRAPAAAHGVARHARLTSVRRLLVDHEIERLNAGHQILERRERPLVGEREPLGER
jgi:hypothetical protein